MNRLLFILLILVALFPLNSAQEEHQDIEISGFELELILALISAFIAFFLFVVSLTAYSRDKRKRILYISIAFLLLSIKNFLLSSELFLPEVFWFDPIIVIFDFVAMMVFFYGTIRR